MLMWWLPIDNFLLSVPTQYLTHTSLLQLVHVCPNLPHKVFLKHMGGCSPSKMPNDEQQVDPPQQQKKKFSISSSFRKNSSHSSNASSLNASHIRIKTLAETDETYAIVKGGRKDNASAVDVVESEKTNGHATIVTHVKDLTKDAESQTVHHRSSNNSHLVHGGAVEGKIARPLHFPLGSKSAFPRAPLAMSETASELGKELSLFMRLLSRFLSWKICNYCKMIRHSKKGFEVDCRIDIFICFH